MMPESKPRYKKQDERETLVFNGRLLPKLPSHYNEPSLTNPLIVPHGAMPANPFIDELVKTQQRDINSEYKKLYETPPSDIPQEFVDDVVMEDFVINEQLRQMQNFQVIAEFRDSGAIIDPEYQQMFELYERGQASIDQFCQLLTHPDLDTRDVDMANLKAGEAGKVAHPYGYRMEYLSPLRHEMDEAIQSNGGVVYPTVGAYRSITILPKVKTFDDGSKFGGQRIIGFIVKYKRDFGHIPVVGREDEVLRIVERQIAAYRVDEASGFDQSILTSMRDRRDQSEGRINWDHHSLDQRAQAAHEHALRATGCRDYVERAVQADSSEDFVVPISTTIYGFKEKLPPKAPIDFIALKALNSSLNRK